MRQSNVLDLEHIAPKRPHPTTQSGPGSRNTRSPDHSAGTGCNAAPSPRRDTAPETVGRLKWSHLFGQVCSVSRVYRV